MKFRCSLFSNPTALVGHDAEVFAPTGCNELDYELELGVVIGRGGRDIPEEHAWDHVFGFTIINDLSARDLQRKEMSVGLGPAKGKDFATAVGPWMVARNRFFDRTDGATLTLEMSARVNGRELSRGNVAALHHSIPKMIAYASRDAELFPGDLIGTGTVGSGCILELGPENTGGWLKPGDVVELEVERIGVLRTRIVARPEKGRGRMRLIQKPGSQEAGRHARRSEQGAGEIDPQSPPDQILLLCAEISNRKHLRRFDPVVSDARQAYSQSTFQLPLPRMRRSSRQDGCLGV